MCDVPVIIFTFSVFITDTLVLLVYVCCLSMLRLCYSPDIVLSVWTCALVISRFEFYTVFPVLNRLLRF
jgi:hypothetical protein